MKKISLLLLISIIFGVLSVSAYTNQEKLAGDFLSYKGIINTQDNPENYELGKEITRKEMAKVTLKLSEKNVPDTCSGIFSDLKSSDWGCKYAEIGVKYNFFSKNKTFNPSNNISKIEAVKMVMKGRGIEREDIDDWKAGYVNAAFDYGLLDEKFTDYDTPATRGWIFVMAQHAIEYSENDEDIKLILELLEL